MVQEDEHRDEDEEVAQAASLQPEVHGDRRSPKTPRYLAADKAELDAEGEAVPVDRVPRAAQPRAQEEEAALDRERVAESGARPHRPEDLLVAAVSVLAAEEPAVDAGEVGALTADAQHAWLAVSRSHHEDAGRVRAHETDQGCQLLLRLLARSIERKGGQEISHRDYRLQERQRHQGWCFCNVEALSVQETLLAASTAALTIADSDFPSLQLSFELASFRPAPRNQSCERGVPEE